MIKKNFLFTVITIFISHIFYAQSSSLISINDTRWTNDTPNFFEHGIRADFKERSYIGVPGDGLYSTNLSIAQWEDTDNSGGKNHQLNFNDGGVFYRNAYPLDSQWGNWQQLLMTNEYGNVGIGTNNPEKKIQINAHNNDAGLRIHAVQGDNNTSTPYLLLTGGYSTNNGVALKGVGDQSYGRKALVFYSGWEGNTDSPLITNLQERMRISSNGNVGIGITNPNNKLDVKGTIHSQEVKVDMNGWSDFVFKKEYNLPTLDEVEKHITENGHLVNIPNEEEVLKNGINLGEMNAKLLQKIEELTLYIIEQNKQMQILKKENESFKSLSAKVLEIENKLKTIN